MRAKPHFSFPNRGQSLPHRRFMRFERGSEQFASRGRRGRRLEHGDLRLLALYLINKTPSHGYELIKAIEDLTAGAYAPSPGVIYPTLTMLEELGHVSAVTEGTKRLFSITQTGKTVLDEAQNAMEAVLSRLTQGPSREAIMPVKRAVENLRMALRMKLGDSTDPTIFRKVTAMIDDLVHQIETL